MRRLSPSFLLTFNKSLLTGDSCSREPLCSEKHSLYKESFDFYFASLIERVNSIKKDVLVGVFSLSPLKLSSSLGDRHKNGFSHGFDFVVRLEKGDDLVLTALARMLSFHFVKSSVFSEKSFGFRTDHQVFYGK